MSDIEWGDSIPYNGSCQCPDEALRVPCAILFEYEWLGLHGDINGNEWGWYDNVVAFKLPKDHPYYNETKKTEQVYVCSLNDDILVGTTEQLMELMVEREWTLAEFLEMTTYKLGKEVELKLVIEGGSKVITEE